MNRKLQMIFFILVVVWIGVIFSMSSKTAQDSDKISRRVTKEIVLTGEKIGLLDKGVSDSGVFIEEFDSNIRNLAHTTMYFIFACMVIIALFYKNKRLALSAALCFIICTGCSILDEVNQMHYLGRNSGTVSGGIYDIIRDEIGICLAIAIFYLVRRTRQKNKPNT